MPLFLVPSATTFLSKDFFAPVLSPIIQYIFRIYTWNSGFPVFHHSLNATDEKWSLCYPCKGNAAQLCEDVKLHTQESAITN